MASISGITELRFRGTVTPDADIPACISKQHPRVVCLRVSGHQCGKCKISKGWCCIPVWLETFLLSSSPGQTRGLYADRRWQGDGHSLSLLPAEPLTLYKIKQMMFERTGVSGIRRQLRSKVYSSSAQRRIWVDAAGSTAIPEPGKQTDGTWGLQKCID